MNTEPTSLAKAILLSLLATASFALVAWTQHELLGHAEGDEVGPKLDYLSLHPGEYDTFFLGSSTIFRQVVPSVFDEVMAKSGQATRSYNLGSPGMGGLEADHALSRLLELVEDGVAGDKPTIFYEPRFPGGTLFEELRTTERTVSWHDFTRTRLAIQMIAESELEGREAFDAVVDAGRCFAWKTTNFAQGPRLLRRFAPWLLEPERSRPYIADSQGYQALEDSTQDNVINRGQEFAKDRKGFSGGVHALIASHGSPVQPLEDSFTEKAVARLQAQGAKEMGATLIGLIPPTMTSMSYARAVADQYHDFYLYNSPRLTPQYFQASGHFDKNHLNREQSEAFTRQLAQDILDRSPAQGATDE